MADSSDISPHLLVRAYCQGIFPMARGRHGPIDWYSPDRRAILPLDRFHVSHSLRKQVKRGEYHLTRDAAFERVIRECAEPRSYEADTWISDEIVQVYTRLHRVGLAHSVEAWQHESEQGAESSEPRRLLVGGLYGVALGGVFFGESMFNRATDASKVCLVHLVEHLRRRGFTLLDVQYASGHLIQFGVIEVHRDEYLRLLDQALSVAARW
ncbi:MAG: leucyl/phenylalanyl-tRNA--protein transferase [Phycisphaeraceae bacterium]